MYNHNKAQQSKNRVHISWDILYNVTEGPIASKHAIRYGQRVICIIWRVTDLYNIGYDGIWACNVDQQNYNLFLFAVLGHDQYCCCIIVATCIYEYNVQ